MDITWLGHSAFKLEESTGTVVVTDPFDGYVGYEMPNVKADAITISHAHPDHNSRQNVLGEPIVIDKEGAFEVKGIHISSIIANHDKHNGRDRGKTLLFKYRIDGVEICHMGDIGEECNPFITESLMPVNVLLIPIGGRYTIDAAQAMEYVERLMPDIVIPMHYKLRETAFGIDKLDEFLSLFDENDILYMNGNSITLDRAQFDGESTKVVVLKK